MKKELKKEKICLVEPLKKKTQHICAILFKYKL
jgi:hypothetical protein